MMKALVTGLIGVTAVVSLAACAGGGSQPGPSLSACTSAMEQQVTYAEAHPGSGAGMTIPAACNGLSASQVRDAAAQAVTKEMP